MPARLEWEGFDRRTEQLSMEPLAFYLDQPYSFAVIPDPDGGYFIHYPDLPGCMTQVEELMEIGPVADEIRILWLETAYDQRIDIPLPGEVLLPHWPTR